MKSARPPLVDQATDPDQMVLCLHCQGGKNDPLEPGFCYLCGGAGVITKGLADHTIHVAETGMNMGSY